MQTTLLNDRQFQATFTDHMNDVTGETSNVIDIWPYVWSIPLADLLGHEIYDQFVECIYRDALGCYDHVQVMTKTKNVYLTIVVDRRREIIHGHHLLDLNERYGLPS